MPLHRDIFWVGKQWSVTGHGLQVIDQKLKGKFDIDASRVWDDDLSDALLDEKWFNAKDFEKAVAEARKRHPQPHGKAARKTTAAASAPAPADIMPAKDPPKATAPAKAVSVPKTSPVAKASPAVKASPAAKASPASKVSSASQPAKFAMRIEGCRAKFLPAWRVRVRWQR